MANADKDGKSGFNLVVRLPRLEDCDDLTLEYLFPTRDGPWSSQTKAALARHGTDRLDLNENWASVDPEWRCPGCSRAKTDLFRLSSADVLIAHLHIHHDHLGDALRKRLQQDIGQEWIHSISPMVRHIEKPVSKILARFSPVLVCSDCNEADAAVKSRLRKIHRDFSFSACEISNFIEAHPNRPHEIKLDVALDIYKNAKEDFDRRLALLDQFAKIIVAGELPQERGNLPPIGVPSPLGMLSYLHSSILRGDGESYLSISQDIDAFQRRSVSRHGTAAHGGKNKPVYGDAPSEEEVLDHHGSGAPDLWSATPGDWHCPACDRTKRSIMRKSNKSKEQWSGRLYRHTEFIIEDGYDDDDIWYERIDHHKLLLICGDCANIVPMLKQRHPDLSRYEVQFQIGDMKGVARAQANCPHEIDWDRAIVQAKEALDRWPLIEEYWSRYHEAVGCKALYRKYLDRANTPERAWGWLRSQYIENGQEVDGLDEYLHYLLEEADRIGVEDPWFRKAQEQKLSGSQSGQ